MMDMGGERVLESFGEVRKRVRDWKSTIEAKELFVNMCILILILEEISFVSTCLSESTLVDSISTNCTLVVDMDTRMLAVG